MLLFPATPVFPFLPLSKKLNVSAEMPGQQAVAGPKEGPHIMTVCLGGMVKLAGVSSCSAYAAYIVIVSMYLS